MDALFEVARSIGSQELWVYTGSSDDIAVSFYKASTSKFSERLRSGRVAELWTIRTS